MKAAAERSGFAPVKNAEVYGSLAAASFVCKPHSFRCTRVQVAKQYRGQNFRTGAGREDDCWPGGRKKLRQTDVR